MYSGVSVYFGLDNSICEHLHAELRWLPSDGLWIFTGSIWLQKFNERWIVNDDGITY